MKVDDAMFYTAGKVLTFFLQPSSLIWIMLVAGLALCALWPRLRRTGLWMCGIALLAMFVAGLSPLANALILPLENRFPEMSAAAIKQPVAGIILLGGAEDGWVTSGRNTLALNEAAERITETARLATQFPDAKIAVTGGAARVFGKGEEGSTAVADLLRDLGVASARLVVETRSRNTFENATLTLPLIGAQPGETWLLVTSAYHIPRAVGVFRNAGLNVMAFPVDYRLRGPEDLARWFRSLPAGLKRFDLVAKEWMGLIAYRLAGRTTALFPAP
ncbi:MAG: YdcF family protein [Hyphomicrobiaceae bacterium]